MDIYSHYLESPLSMDTYAIEGVSGVIVPHKELRRIVNTLPSKLSINSETLVCDTTNGVYAFRVTVADSDKSVSEIGEANKVNLCSAIAQQYPITMAYARAFDRAVIAFLALEEKVMSDFEVKFELSQKAPEPEKVISSEPKEEPKEEPKVAKAPPKAAKTAPAPVSDDDFDIEIDDDPDGDIIADISDGGKGRKKSAPVATVDDSDDEISLEDFADETPTKAKATAKPTAKEVEDYGKTVVLAGQYKGKTLADVLAAGDKKTLKWYTSITLKSADETTANEFRRKATAFWETVKE